MSRYSTAFLALIALLLMFASSQAADPDPWKDYRFLLGSWSGGGKGAAGVGKGQFTFNLDLNDKIMVRKHKSEVEATAGRPAATHEDLLIMYPDAGGKKMRASYFDNEGHVIQYEVTLSEDKKTLTFLSDAAPGAPRFRLTYAKEKDGELGIKFELALPNKPDEFKVYTEGSATREKK
jgi:hypothetical protein